ncbi:MAG: HlyC/CorC family transporter [Candidatus Heteroscillospira sp.]|jgi:putative hemolysin
MNEHITTLVIMAVLVLLSAYFSATETAFSSMNRTRIKSMADYGDKRAQRVLELSSDYDRLLSTILVGNNIVNIGLASIGTALFIKLLGESYGPSVSTVVVTVVVLIFGEISPKSLAKEDPERFAMLTAPSVAFFIALLRPVNFLFSCWKKLLSRVFNVRSDRRLTHNELLTLVEEVEQEGGLDKNESELLRSAIEFSELTAADILTPRVDLDAVSLDSTAGEIARMFTSTGYSRLPVYDGSIDRIVGIINQKDFYAAPRLHEENPAADIIKPPLFIPPNTPISRLLRMLQHNKAHMAVVADEYGGTMGIVTMEDILEELVGEIWDEHDEVIEEIVKKPDGAYRVICSAELHRLFDYFNIRTEPEASTVSGWVMENLGRVPQLGDSFTADGLAVTVTRTDRQRLLEIEIKVLEE